MTGGGGGGALVWVSRPAEAGVLLARALERGGLRALLAPAIRIEEVGEEALARYAAEVAAFDASVFVSRAAAARVAAFWAGGGGPGGEAAGGALPALAIGRATAAALGPRYVLLRDADGVGDSRRLAAEVMAVGCARVALLGGTDEAGARPAPALAAALREEGVAVAEFVVYRRVAAAPDAVLRARGRAGEIAAAVAYSGDSLRAMLAMTAPDNDWLRCLPLFVPHVNVAAVAEGLGFCRVLVLNPSS